MSWSNPAQAPKRSRCAIYTRKSSEEGLDMEFNSLDALRSLYRQPEVGRLGRHPRTL